MADQDLVAALKMAKGREMYFAFYLKGSAGKLIVSKAKIGGKQLAEAKSEVGGGALYKGKCFGKDGAMVFQVAKAPPGTLGAALKKAAKDAGLSIIPDVQVGGAADEDEGDDGGGGPAAVAAGPAAAAQAPPAPEPVASPEPDDESKGADELDLGPWLAARQKAITDLKGLAARIAGTKHGTAMGVLKELNAVITKLPAKPGPKDIDKLADFISSDETISAVEDVPDAFHNVYIRDSLLNALKGMRK